MVIVRDKDGVADEVEKPMARHRSLLTAHLIVVQPASAPRLEVDEALGIDLDPSGREGRSRHRMVVRGFRVSATDKESLDDLGIDVGAEASVEVSYHLESLRGVASSGSSD